MSWWVPVTDANVFNLFSTLEWKKDLEYRNVFNSCRHSAGYFKSSIRSQVELPLWLSNKKFACKAGRGFNPWVGKIPCRSKSNPLQYSCQENCKERGGWRVTVHEVAKSWTWLRKETMTKLESILKSRDITLPTKICIVNLWFFPVVLYRCKSWTIKKAECQRTDAFKLSWKRLLRIPWTARTSNQSIPKKVNPDYSLEGLMLKLKHSLATWRNEQTCWTYSPWHSYAPAIWNRLFFNQSLIHGPQDIEPF